MSKTHKIDVRLEADELLELERQAKILNMPKSRLARILLTGAAVSKPQPQQPPAAAPAFDDSRLADIERRLGEVEESLSASARAFDMLLQQLGEFLRVPSFREYRARLVVEGVEKRQNEDDAQFLVRAASRYFVLFQAWPDPTDSRRFGPVPQGVDLAKFPPRPPA